MSNWILIGTTLFLGAIALIVPYLSELIKRRLFAPQLEIHFSENPPACHKTRLKGGNASGRSIDEPVFYFRFRVVNVGKSQAKRCEAVIENLLIANAEGIFPKDTHYTPVNLIWGGSYAEYIDINPRRSFYCDLLHVPSQNYQDLLGPQGAYVNPPESGDFNLGAILNVKAAFYVQPNRLPPGKYKIDVVVYSENAEEVRRGFLVTWTGKWQDREQDMFQELVIQ